MKIIHIELGKPNPNTANGVNKFVHDIATELDNQNQKVEVWSIVRSRKIEFRHAYKLRIFNKRKMFLLDKKIYKEIDKLDVDNTVFHFHSVFILEFYSIVKYLIKNKIKYFISPHSGYSTNSLRKNFIFKYLYIQLFESKIIKNATFIHVNNQMEVEYFNKIIKHKNIIITPNGFNLDDKEYNFKKKSQYIIGYMGRFSIEQKGLDLLFNGFSDYLNNGGKGLLYLIGHGNLEVLFNKLDKNTLDNITVFEPKFGKEKEKLFSKMSIFIHTSRWEGFPFSLVEAAANSLPLIVSKATNLGSYIRTYNAGIELKDNDVKNISEALFTGEKLFNEKVLQNKMSFNAYNMVKEEFRWDSITKELLKYYLIASSVKFNIRGEN